MKISDKHISVVIENDVKAIAQPFFEITGIDYFHYAEFYKSGYCFSLCSNAEWHKFFFEDKIHCLNVDFPTDGYHLCAIKNPILAEKAKNYFKIDHFFTFTKEYKDYYIIAGFGTAYGNDKIIDYYLNNRDVLDKFIVYFKEKANTLIKLSNKEENRIIMPEFYCKDNFRLKQLEVPSVAFLNLKNSSVAHGMASLSKRELDCIRYLLLGKTMRETGEKLFISPRTVETHLDNVKNKLGCYKKTDLMTILFKNGFAQALLSKSTS